MGEMPRTVVTSAEFTRQFGYLRQSHGDAPVFITHHGRETHVLLTAARYGDMVETRRAPRAEVGAAIPSVHELANWLDHALLVLDEDLTIVLANATAHTMSRQPDASLCGRNLFEALPEVKGSLIEMYLHRAQSGGGHCAADLPSLYRKDAWIRLQIFPTANGLTLLTHDITQDVQRFRLADTKKATIDALGLHGGIGTIRLNARAQIAQVDAAMTAMLKIPEARLLGIGLLELVPVAHRVALRAQLDHVLGGNGGLRVETEFLTNDGAALPLCGGLVELRGAYAAEGALLVVTRG